MTPTCPTGYACTFTPKNVNPGPWWEGTWGTVVAIGGVIGLLCLLAWAAWLLAEARAERRRDARERENRAHKERLAEHFAHQLDAAEGSPEMLDLIREMQRRL